MREECSKCGADAPNGPEGPRNHRDAEECIQAAVRAIFLLTRRVEALEAERCADGREGT